MARVNLPFVVMGGLIVGLASGCAAPGRRIESGAEKLSCTELLALMVDLPESWPESPPETMRIGELLQREIVARGGEAFFD
ncbi:MAG: hypothetical protein JXA90_09530, partial [Planctomycetes bacterium]|nr:hypothetical protein [Planctomycetota bacterium]